VPDTPTATATSTQIPSTAAATQQAVSEDSPYESYYDYGDYGPEISIDSSDITIANFNFGPDELEVKVGTKVTWTNQEGTRHTVTSDDESFDSGAIENGGTFSFTFNEVGTFIYHCNIHPAMVGAVIVTP
jgi:plastocyanin